MLIGSAATDRFQDEKVSSPARRRWRLGHTRGHQEADEEHHVEAVDQVEAEADTGEVDWDEERQREAADGERRAGGFLFGGRNHDAGHEGAEECLQPEHQCDCGGQDQECELVGGRRRPVDDVDLDAASCSLRFSGFVDRGRYRRWVGRPEICAFAEDHLDAAGSLLAARHREHRSVEPLLSEDFEDPVAARGEVALLWAQEHASGAVARRGRKVVGFLLGTRKDDEIWGANVWVEAAGYAVEEPELVRDLYGFSSQRWVDEGRSRHYALVPNRDDHVAAWFRLSFGAQQAHGVKEVDVRVWPSGTRRAEHRDVEALIELAPLIHNHHALAPVFSGTGLEDADELRAMITAYIANDEVGELVYERDGRVVACFELVPVDKGSMHGVRGVAQPKSAAHLEYAASLPDVRGSGAGLALTDAAFAWAHEQGYATIVTDWRETNLLSSRFWPARGFRRSFLRLYRSIP